MKKEIESLGIMCTYTKVKLKKNPSNRKSVKKDNLFSNITTNVLFLEVLEVLEVILKRKVLEMNFSRWSLC